MTYVNPAPVTAVSAISKQLCFIVLLLAFAGLFQTTLTAQCTTVDPTLPLGVVPSTEPFPGGPPECNGGFRINSPAAGLTNVDFDLDGVTDMTIEITEGPCGEILTWTTAPHIVLDQLIAKGGTDQNVYDYTGLNPRPSTDGNLHSPVVSSGFYADFSHVDFCYHYRLNVSKTAKTQFTRTYMWNIDKTCDGPASLTLTPGQVYNYPFTWVASVSGYADSDWKVTGTITIKNNSPHSATITSVSDVLSGGQAVTLDCGTLFPYVLVSGATLNCTYTANLPAGVNGANTVTVVTSTPLVEGNTATVPFVFGDPTTWVDDCITVSDDCQSPSEVCVASAPITIKYTCPISYDVCGNYTYTNTASFVTSNTATTGSDNCSVAVVIPCLGGCTLTIGYWKTHSQYGPAPYDNTWALVGENTPFFLSGKTWYQAAWTAPAGNAYYILAHQYIAAKLNFLNGASIPPAVQTAFNTATNLFNTHTPAYIGGLGGNNNLRKQFVNLATTLDNYNNGLTGPGHCSESNERTGTANEEQNRNATQATGSFSLYPNPAKDAVQVDLSNFMEQSVDLILYDQLGARVLARHIGKVETAVYTLRFDRNLPSGHYLLTMLCADQALTKSLILSNE